MNFKRFLTVFVLSTLVLGVLAFNTVDASYSASYAGWGKTPTGTKTPTKTKTPTPTLQPTPTPTTSPGGGSGTVDYGSLYGDLYVILRDMNGVPILDEYGCIQPIDADGNTLTLYTNPAEDILCELTPDLALLVQAVDFGRLNMGRAPNAVLFHAFDEAINLMNSATAFDLDPAGRVMMLINGKWKTIDAPAENLALYIKLMQEGHWVTTDTSPVVRGGQPEGMGPPEGDGPSAEPRPVLSATAIDLLGSIGYSNLGNVNNVLDSHDLLLAASLLSAAGDKTGTMTLDKVIYINSILGINQLGTLPGEVDGITYFDFSGFNYSKLAVYGPERSSMECPVSLGSSYVWVLRPADTSGLLWTSDCLNTLDEVHHLVGNETSNVRGFVQAADDALQVIEYIHEFRVPVPLPELP